MLNNEQARAVSNFCKSLIPDEKDLLKVQDACIEYLGQFKDERGNDLSLTETIEYGGQKVVFNRIENDREDTFAIEYMLDLIAGVRPDDFPLVEPNIYIASIFNGTNNMNVFIDIMHKIKKGQRLGHIYIDYDSFQKSNFGNWMKFYADNIPDDFILIRFDRAGVSTRFLQRFTILPKLRALACYESFGQILRFMHVTDKFYVIEPKNHEMIRSRPNSDELVRSHFQDPSQKQKPANSIAKTHKKAKKAKASQKHQGAYGSTPLGTAASTKGAAQSHASKSYVTSYYATNDSSKPAPRVKKEVELPKLMPENDLDCFN